MGEEVMTAEIEPIDDRRELIVPGNYDETLEFCVEHWIDCAKEAVHERGRFNVALSGGSTPKKIFEMLCGEKYWGQIPWPRVHLYWSDERAVGPDDPDSNYRMAMESGFGRMPLPEDNIHRMRGEGEMNEGAQWYEREIKEGVEDQQFDLVMLGMGDDGHTASLFPHTEALSEKRRLVVGNYVPKLDTWRMTFTYPLINQAHHICFYVLGSSKSEMLAKVLKGDDAPEELPSQAVGTSIHKALWIADHSAAELL